MNIKKWMIGTAIAFCFCAAAIFFVAIFNSSQGSSSKANSFAAKSVGGSGSDNIETATTTTPVTQQRKITGSGAILKTNAETGAKPVSRIGGHPVVYPGKFAKAEVRTGNQVFELTPNQLGNFQQIQMGPKQKVSVQVAFPEGQPGDPVAIEVKDGGQLDGKQMAEVVALDNQDDIQFQFQTTDQSGIYRIALRSGADVKVVNFWVGPQTASR